MQKSKSATIGIIIMMILYGFFVYSNWVSKNNFIYLYIINPIFWLGLAIFLRLSTGKNYENRKNKREIIEYCAIGVLVYIITYMILGLFITFGKNPYSTKITGIITNIWILGVSIIAKEYIRCKLIQNVYEKDKIKIAIAISIVYIFIDANIGRFFYGTITAYYILKQIAQTFIPLIATNALCSYVSINSNYIPAVIYQMGVKLYLWISPILPNAPWIMISIIDSIIPIIIIIYIRYMKSKKDIFKSKERIEATDPKSIIPLVIGIILAMWFGIGIFPIKPVAIATGSMEQVLYPGDVVIIKKCNSEEIIVGDIIQYQMEGYTVIHRVTEKKQRNGSFYFTTKGDNNKHPDTKEVSEKQLIGKVIFKIKYIGYPAIWLHFLQEDQTQVDIDT